MLNKEISIDLNKDGNPETVMYEKGTSIDPTIVLHINKGKDNGISKEYNVRGTFGITEDEFYKIEFCDIDKTDNYIEIVVNSGYLASTTGKSGNYFHVLRYDGKDLISLNFENEKDGFYEFDFQNVKGDGKLPVYAKYRLVIDWYGTCMYDLKEDTLFYDDSKFLIGSIIETESLDNDFAVKKDVSAYKDRDTSSEKVSIKQGQTIYVVALYDKEWMEVTTEDGTVAYFHVLNERNIESDGTEMVVAEYIDINPGTIYF